MGSSNTDFNNKRVLILGAGKEGTSAASFLYAQFPNAIIHLADQKGVDFELSGVRNVFGDKYPSSLKEYDIVVTSPGIPPHDQLLQTATNVTTPTNIFFEHVKGTVVGVTGSKGKSTTSALIHSMLKNAGRESYLVGNGGNPALEELTQHNRKKDIFIFELSSYQTRLMEQGPDIAVLTTLFPDHMDYHGSVEQYYKDKLHLVEVLSDEQQLIFNGQNKKLKSKINHIGKNGIEWPSPNGAHVQEEQIFFGDAKIVRLDELQLLGEHNVSNVLGALTTAAALNATTDAMRKTLLTFSALPNRLEFAGEHNGITFIDDSLSTTPESTIAAIKSFERIGTIFLGGQERGYDFTELAEVIAEKQIPNIVFFPNSGAAIHHALDKLGYTPNSIETESMEEAVQFAYKHTPKGTACLLSCASPSYYTFKNYEDRSNQFNAAVDKFANK